MSIHMNNVFPILAHAIADFEASEEDWKEGAPYFFLSDIRHFVCNRAGSGSLVEIDQFAVLLEKLVVEGDRDVRDMVLDSLKGLCECDLKDVVAKRFGPKVQQVWASVSRIDL